MELSPQSVSSTTFKIVKKGYDPDEVKNYLVQLASSIESMQSHTSAMEARARAAVARLQEIAAQTPSQQAADTAGPSPEETETISRTLLLAQRTADQTVADAEAKAKAVAEAADADARSAVEAAQTSAARLIEDAKFEARKAGEGQRQQIEGEVQSLLARREFLMSDVDHLEQHIITQRERLRDVATQLTDMVDRVPGGLGDVRRPLTSAVEPEAGVADGATSADLDATMPMERTELASPTADTAEGAPSAAAAPELTEAPANTESSSEPPAPSEDLDPIWSESADKPADTVEPDTTPASGAATQYSFEDVTAEVPSIGSEGDKS